MPPRVPGDLATTATTAYEQKRLRQIKENAEMLKVLGLDNGFEATRAKQAAIRRREVDKRWSRSCFKMAKKEWITAVLSPDARAARSAARARVRRGPDMSAYSMATSDSDDDDSYKACNRAQPQAELTTKDVAFLRDLERQAWKLVFQGNVQLRVALQRYLR